MEASVLERIQSGEYQGFAQIDDAVYNCDTNYFRSSWISPLLKSPAHLKYIMNSPCKSTEALIFGRALHMRLGEPERYRKEVACAPSGDRRTAQVKGEWKKFTEENAGKLAIPEDTYEKIETIAHKVLNDSQARLLLRGGIAEQAMFWVDNTTQVKCKARMDVSRLDENLIIDFKSCENADLSSFERQIGKYGLHRNAAMYCSGASHLTEKYISEFILFAIEKNPPYEFAMYQVNAAALEKGMEEYQNVLRAYKDCITKNEWPGYPREIQDIGLPSWEW